MSLHFARNYASTLENEYGQLMNFLTSDAATILQSAGGQLLNTGIGLASDVSEGK